MPDSDPNRPRDFAERFRDQIHDEILERRRAKMQRRMDRLERRGMHHHPFGGVLIGTILAGVGVLLLLQNLGITVVEDIWEWWPVILIAIGAARLITGFGWSGRIFGGILMFAGGVFLLHNLGYIHGDPWNYFWPVILIAVGLGMLARGIDRGGVFVWWPTHPITSAGSSTGAPATDALAEYAVFGGVRRRIESQKFEGGELLAFFGGINIDLTKAAIQQEEVRLEANALFGGIDIRVPDTWHVAVHGAGIFGGYEDKTWHTATTTEDKRPRLVITGFAMFGGVTVKTV
jgi:hypothetical protein